MQGAVADFVEAVPLPTLLIRGDARIEAANGPALALLGKGIQGRHFAIALRQPALLEAIEGGFFDGAARQTEIAYSTAGQDSTFRITVRSVALEEGRGVLVTFEDVTPLETISQMRRDFVANVSHELRTPLTALIGFIDTLKGPARNDPEGQQRFLGIMESEAARMNRLVDDLLSLSRVEAEARVRPTDDVAIADLIVSMLDRLRPLADEAGVRLFSDLPDRAFTIPGDEDQLRQVLSNLVENGIKYAGEGAAVTVSLGEPQHEAGIRGPGVRLVVRDTGRGIDPYHLPRLTERFYRVDGGRAREKGGTGLGLAIVKHIVSRHRGRMRVDSALGQGTEFTLILPVE